MKRMIATALLLAVMSSGVWALQSAPPASVQPQAPARKTDVPKKRKTSSKKTSSSAAQSQQLPAQTTPPLPATLMNSAPVKPSVSMQSGLLTIDAPNSTLSDVLNGVHKATGATIEGATPTERVAVKLGPGNPEQVLAALLRGTPYDYVILGSLGKQDVVTRVLLTQESLQPSADGGTTATASPQAQETPQPQQIEDGPVDRMPPDEAAAQATPDTEPDPGRQQQAQPAPQDPNQPKTPEQLFKELQQLEQQKQPR